MGGICGIVYNEPGRVDKGLLRKARGPITRQGPDDEGCYSDEHAGLAVSRLSVIGLRAGHQPVPNRDGAIHAVFIGDLYNFPELREELEKDGYPFKTGTDTELIVALYEKMGTDCVCKLRGMFALAVWDGPRQRLFLARDRIGKKSLAYSLRGGFFAFASELRSLLVWPGVSAEVDAEAVDLYLSLQYIPSPHTIYKGIRKLLPGHRLVFEKGRLTVECYWDYPLGQAPATRHLPEAEEMIRAKLREAVKLRMIADVPLGAFLSGGIDSSIIVALMSEMSEKPVKTFAIGFEEEEFSELPYAREVSERYGTDHREFIVTADMADVLPKLAWNYGEPYADASALPSYYVARETKRFVGVALNGDGGDENFAGYVRYFAMKAARYFDIIPGPVRRAMQLGAEFLPEKNAPISFLWRLKRFLRSAVFTDLSRRHLKMICYFSEEDKNGLYTGPMLRALGPAQDGRSPAGWYLKKAFDGGESEDFVNRMLYTDMKTYLPECMTVKMDIATGANSLQGRSPLLDHEFMELVFRMPGDWKLKGLNKHKWILKRAFKDHLPPTIRKRGKMGFGIPLGPWFRGRLKDYWRDHVLSPEALARGYFDKRALQSIWDEHQSRKRDHGYRMWALLMLELWHRQYLPDFKGF
ncbi:MAG: asparagine synthase (glutamine-hydrolyzing) [Elusimicrobiota bacterium]